VASKAEVSPGEWHFDYAGNRIYIGVNPAGKTVEVSQGRHAFFCGGSSCDGVTVRGLTIEKFANPGQWGAIHMLAIGGVKPKNWVIEGNVIRLNHGAGVDVSDRAIVRDNYIYMNGQLGLHGTGVSNVLIEDNEISYNNFAGFSDGWESGGFKFITNVSNLTVRNNYSHHNDGPGMWTDYVGGGTLYEGNIVEYNTSMGIQHEISLDAVIRNNTVRFNSSPGLDGWAFGAQIMVQNSSDVEVYGNRVVVGPSFGDGITVVQQNRVVSGQPRPGINNSVHHNEVWYLGNSGVSGIFSDSSAPPPLDKQSAWSTNSFDYNVYHAPNLNASRWETNGRPMFWSEFRAAGEEAHGLADTDLSQAP
jgi:parallel beta-helix repeat protein